MANINWDTIGFDAYKTDKVIMAKYFDGKWSEPQVHDFRFSMDPFSCSLHYAISCFEGLKAFRQKNGDIIMFRPEENARRLARTADYLGLPPVPEEQFISMCALAVKENIEYLPPYGHEASLYVRPLLFGTLPQMQLVPPKGDITFAVMVAPAGSYYGAHLKSFAAVIPQNYDRAAPLGSGSYKVGANYACTFKPYKIAHEQGYTELLFLNSRTHEYVDEFGSSNFFGIKGDTYVTPLSDSVLPSITNKTLRQVAEDFGMKVEIRPIPVGELAEFGEAAACGTAVVITPMSHIDIKPVLERPEVEKEYRYFPDGVVGETCTKLYKRIVGIQFGELEDTHGWCRRI